MIKMGYESKLYVVNKRGSLNGESKRWAEVVAVFNMCKFGDFNGVFIKETDCFIYADDGNTEITEDKYGDSLKEASVEDVIKYLEEYKDTQEPYRRVEPLLGLLKGFDVSEWEDLIILHYGY
jgi:hypothetical protein